MATITEHTVHYTANGDKKIFYLSAGPKEGPLLIFLHGWPAIAKTWVPQIEALAAKGYHVVAPDMPGYGGSTYTKVTEDYSHEVINAGLLALLKDVGKDKAIWLGHDWGAGVLCSLAAVHPEVFHAACFMAVPYRVIEFGIPGLVKTVNRDIYPEEKYPFGPWEYQVYYERHFEEATAWFEKDIAGCLRAFYAKGDPSRMGQPAFTSTTDQDGGWFGGIAEPPKAFHDIPSQALCISEDLYKSLVAAMEKTGFWSADAYYANHARNSEYVKSKQVNNGNLTFPVLFIEANWDAICDTAISKLADPMRESCKDLTYVSIDAGHWVAQEQPDQTNAAIVKWLDEKVKVL